MKGYSSFQGNRPHSHIYHSKYLNHNIEGVHHRVITELEKIVQLEYEDICGNLFRKVIFNIFKLFLCCREFCIPPRHYRYRDIDMERGGFSIEIFKGINQYEIF